MTGMSNLSPKNRRDLVTGGARGIGAANAGVLAARGVKVTIADRDGDVAEKTASALRALGGTVSTVSCDVTDPAQIDGLAAALPVLDILINNAAICDSTPISELIIARVEQVQQVNQNAAHWVALAFPPQVRASHCGRVVSIASITGLRGVVDAVSFSTAKGGIINMTPARAVDLAPDGILVNCICPGFVDTRRTVPPDGSGHEPETDGFQDIYLKYGPIPRRRAAQSEEVAKATAFFCGDDCADVSSQVLVTSGRSPVCQVLIR